MTTQPAKHAQTTDSEKTWHAQPVEQVLDSLETNVDGLSPDETAQRLERFGPNRIEEEQPTSPFVLLLHQFRSPLIYILVVAAIATLLLEEYIDAAVIAFVLLLNAVIGFTQERQAERSIQALKQLVSPRARVVRAGREREVESTELVPGDVVLFESGTRVPADVRIISASSLMADESLFTGESISVSKSPAEIEARAQVADRSNMLFAGTTITSGRSRGVVVETGANTELGAIAEQVRGQDEGRTPLQERMDRFARIIGGVVLASVLIAFMLGLAVGISASEMFMVGVGLAVAAVPEGLPVVFTITLAIGVHRMARRNAIIRSLPAVETLGSTTLVGSDKTGTLTENRMTVQRIWTAEGEFFATDAIKAEHVCDIPTLSELSLEDYPALELTLLAGVMTNEAEVYFENDNLSVHGDPTEAALLVSARHAGLNPESLRRERPVRGEIPFESDLQYSACLRQSNGKAVLYVKGAPERVLEMCSTIRRGERCEPIEHDQVLNAATTMARDGLRVLAAAVRVIDDPPGEGEDLPEPEDLTLAGLQGMLDPPRGGVHQAIAGCQHAGIRVLMITGDHAETASAIGRQLGISDEGDKVVTGRDMDRLSDEELPDVVDRVSIFARVSPTHKLRVVQAAKQLGHVVGVTGDGVNDAPALKAADIGIAMGKSGTDVAREASDMVLTDDNFVSIYSAVEQGRVTFDNVRKVTFFLISTGAAAIVTMLSALVFGWPLPLLPAQLLWLNLVTNGLQDVALAFEPGDPDVLDRPPRDQKEGIVSGLLWERTAIVGLVMAVGTLLMFWWELQRDVSLEQAQSVALTTMVIFQMFHVGNARSEYRSAFQISPFSNPFLLIATSAAFAVHVAALYFPATQFILRVEPISFEAWMRIIPTALTIVAVVELHKLLRRGKTGKSPSRRL